MEIRVDGSRSSAENWMLAQSASSEVLPALNDDQKKVADNMGISHADYARIFYAIDLTRNELMEKAEHAARLLENMARRKVPDLTVDAVWLMTFEGKFRFDFRFNQFHSGVWVNEDLVDELLQSGSKAAEEQLARIIEFNLPASWIAKAS